MPSFYLSTPHHDVIFSLHSLASLAIHGRFPPSTFFVLQSPTLTPFSTEPSPSPSPPAAWAFPSPPTAALPDEGSSYASHSAHPSSSSHHSHASYRESVWVALSRRRRRSGGATVLLGIRLGLDDALHFPAIRRHRGPAPKLLILLRRHAERRALLPRPAPLVPSRPSVPAACTVGGVLVLDIGAPRVLRRVPRAAGLCARGEPADDGKRAEDKLVDDAGGMMRAEVLYLRAPSPAELRTFHCEKMRKMPLSGLDPSMLIRFACRGGVGWVDLRRRIALDEPLTSLSADDDDDMGLESVWDPEEEAVDADDGEGSVRFFDEGPPSASHGGDGFDDVDAGRENDNGDDIEDDWVDPAPVAAPVAALAPVKKSKSASEGQGGEGEAGQDEEGGGGASAERALSAPVHWSSLERPNRPHVVVIGNEDSPWATLVMLLDALPCLKSRLPDSYFPTLVKLPESEVLKLPGVSKAKKIDIILRMLADARLTTTDVLLETLKDPSTLHPDERGRRVLDEWMLPHASDLICR
ncbi:hypothetical protein C8J57DRAFT_1511001 [Mycena rebaudengoi]|nr:hypothetical protein C8J57DRAFT_1511001 [Mycena rebaudengoi]